MIDSEATSRRSNPLNRKDILLAALSRGNGVRPFQPVHVQKAMFLIDRLAPDVFERGSRYRFQPYDYGPFDSEVYADLDMLELGELVSVERDDVYGYRRYQTTEAGAGRGQDVLQQLRPDHRQVIEKVVDRILPLSFRDLVAAIYRSYPEMKANSIFKG